MTEDHPVIAFVYDLVKTGLTPTTNQQSSSRKRKEPTPTPTPYPSVAATSLLANDCLDDNLDNLIKEDKNMDLLFKVIGNGQDERGGKNKMTDQHGC